MPSFFGVFGGGSASATQTAAQVKPLIGDSSTYASAAGAAGGLPAGSLSVGDIVTLQNDGTGYSSTYQVTAAGDGSFAGATKVLIATTQPSGGIAQVITTTAPIVLSAAADATILADAATAGGAMTAMLPLISSIPAGQTRRYTLKKADSSAFAVSYQCAGADVVEQINSNPIAFAATLALTIPGAVTVVSDSSSVPPQWLII